MRRRGSPFTGVGVVLAKEAADYLSGARMWLLEAVVFLTAIASAYAAILSIRASIGESPFLFLRLLTMAQDPLPSFIALLGFLIPLVAIAIGFDDPATGALKNCYAVSRGPNRAVPPSLLERPLAPCII
jgi:ABC-2 type transport system permease protein